MVWGSHKLCVEVVSGVCKVCKIPKYVCFMIVSDHSEHL